MTELRGWAESEFRSLNAHLEYLLRRAVNERRKHEPEDDGEQTGG